MVSPRTVTVSRELIQAGALAFNIDVAVHHDPDAARAAGLADIIMATPQLSALVERFVLETFNARVSDLRLSMRRPVLAGTVIIVDGQTTHRGWDVSVSCDGVELATAQCS